VVGVKAVARLFLGWVLVVAGLSLAGPPPANATPRISISAVIRGLHHPWDITWVGELMLYDLRDGRLYSRRGSAAPRRVSIPLPRIFAQSEGGLLGLVADPSAASNRRFYTCQATAHRDGSPRDVRVLRWRLTSDTRAVADGTVVTGLPLSTGRHSGCRLRFGADGLLYVATGDAARTSTAQDLSSLGGKILRIHGDGRIPRDNPFYNRGGRARYVWNYGHRNLQGLALRPGSSQLWSAEHGTFRDDEVNIVRRGGNYGWQPGPGYDESRPMTDVRRFPRAIRAKWRSGSSTVATSGLTFVSGSSWGRWQGALAVAMLKGQGIKLLFLTPSGRVGSSRNIPGVGAYGRIRTVQQGPDGALWFTTSNGGGRDVIGRIVARATPPAVRPGQNVRSAGVTAARTSNDIYAFVRGTGDAVRYRRSLNDGRTWSGWRRTGLVSTIAPSVASSSRGRIDIITRDRSGRLRHHWLSGGRMRGGTDLGLGARAATVSSTGRGKLDVVILRSDGSLARKHSNGKRWSQWRSLGGRFTSAAGLSANVTTRRTVVTARGASGEIRERVITPTSDGSRWTTIGGRLWSARALGDTRRGVSRVAASIGSDGYVIVRQGRIVLGLPVRWTANPDVVSRPDGSWILFGRDTRNRLSYYDARPGRQRARSLGGTVR
jgi:glucose/arabinose dehydrogenase